MNLQLNRRYKGKEGSIRFEEDKELEERWEERYLCIHYMDALSLIPFVALEALIMTLHTLC